MNSSSGLSSTSDNRQDSLSHGLSNKSASCNSSSGGLEGFDAHGATMSNKKTCKATKWYPRPRIEQTQNDQVTSTSNGATEMNVDSNMESKSEVVSTSNGAAEMNMGSNVESESEVTSTSNGAAEMNVDSNMESECKVVSTSNRALEMNMGSNLESKSDVASTSNRAPAMNVDSILESESECIKDCGSSSYGCCCCCCSKLVCDGNCKLANRFEGDMSGMSCFFKRFDKLSIARILFAVLIVYLMIQNKRTLDQINHASMPIGAFRTQDVYAAFDGSNEMIDKSFELASMKQEVAPVKEKSFDATSFVLKEEIHMKEIQSLLEKLEKSSKQLKRLLQWKSDHTFKLDNESLKTAVELWFSNRTECEEKYGMIEDWNTSEVTNMEGLFQFRKEFNENISMWDVSKVTDMSYMFWGAKSFNRSLESWDVSKVTSMSYMFHGASSFNQSLSSWNVSKVTNMFGMFAFASSFNQSLSSWDVSKVTNMFAMFDGASSFNVSINAPWYK